MLRSKLDFGKVNKIKCKNIVLPHVGWNDVNFKKHSKFLTNIKFNTFYFTHSYAFKCFDKSNVLGSTFYGETFHSIINKNNVYGVQFHPEKSEKSGLSFLKNFFKFK